MVAWIDALKRRLAFLGSPRRGSQDETLVRRLVEGDKSCVDVFVCEYAPRLFSAFLPLCGGNESDAEDLTFRTLECGYSKIASFRGQSSLFSWLYRIGHRFRLMDVRGKARQAEELMADVSEDIPDTCGNGGDLAETASEVERLEAAMAMLPAKMRDVVQLRFYEDLDVAEIASCLGIRSGTVKSRLHYAFQRLKELLSE